MSVRQGIVVKSTGSWYNVKSGEDYISCKIKGNFRQEGITSTNPVVVGDSVSFEMIKGDNEGTGLITQLHERKNYLVRKAIKESKRKQIIAANIDQALLVVTLDYPETFTLFIDRFLVTTEAYRIPAVLVFNKIDLYDDSQKRKMEDMIAVYEKIGYKCLKVSAETENNLEALKTTMQDNVNVIAGHSGVGKSTLLNKIDPRLNLKVASVSPSHKTGKHATTFSEMFQLAFGGSIVDTPGIKGFGLVDFERWEIPHYFPEMFSRSGECSFRDCTHTHEPGCAVKTAVENGEIAEFRYNNYLEILKGGEDKYRKDKHRK